MDSALLAEGIDYLLQQEGFDIHSLTVIRGGHIVTDAYFYPFTAGGLHDLASVTKSFTATLVGIAIEEGLIEGLDQPVLSFFADRGIANVDTDKESMTLEDLLTMSSGLECTHDPPDFTTMQMFGSPDWVQFAIDLRMQAAPGTRWVYCSPGSHLLSAIVAASSGRSTHEFAQEALFGPLGITDVIWLPDPQGLARGWGDLIMAPHDMAKLGYLYLRAGEWDGQQVLPSDWVMAATSPAVAAHYGYQWWLDPSESAFYADGRGGQRIFVFPDQDLLVVTTGGGGDSYGVLGTLLSSYVLPAVTADAPLPADPDGLALLEAREQQAATPDVAAAKPVPPLPDTASRVSERSYVLDANPVGLVSASLTFGEGAEASLSLRFADGSQVEWLIGLDHVPRVGRGLYGLPAAATGAWESDDVFVIDLDEIGRINKDRVRTTFEGDRVTIQGLDITLTGTLEE
ncbi:MAG: serine hydrolase [Chloroflexota bacterium]|jgi:CubicO group peptidase (beta-lactamase class C family)